MIRLLNWISAMPERRRNNLVAVLLLIAAAILWLRSPMLQQLLPL